MRLRFLVCLFMAPFLFSCAGGYVSNSGNARRAFSRGQFDKALTWYQKQEPLGKDQILYWLDEATILQAAGRNQESLALFQKAIDRAEALTGPQVGSKAASVITNDNIIPYQGEKFEKLLMHVFQVMNYLALGEAREALVEVRRIHTKFSDLQNAFATYLAGLVWEHNGKINDAYIDYKTTFRIDPELPSLGRSLLNLSQHLGMKGDYARWKKQFPDASPMKKGDGELILLLEEGFIPEKESTEENYQLQVVPVPHYPKPVSSVPGTQFTINGKMGKTYPLYRIDEAAWQTLKDNMPGILTRAVARVATKEAAAVAVEKKVDEGLGFLLGLLFLSTNRADLRSWLTLPRSLQVATLPLPEGEYQLKLSWPNGSKTLEAITIKANRKTFLTQRIF